MGPARTLSKRFEIGRLFLFLTLLIPMAKPESNSSEDSLELVKTELFSTTPPLPRTISSIWIIFMQCGNKLSRQARNTWSFERLERPTDHYLLVGVENESTRTF